MFTGIIETMANVVSHKKQGTNIQYTFSCALAQELKVDQSVAHNGVCLTVTSINNCNYTVTAIDETLKRTNLGALTAGDKVNIERCVPANGRFDGHIVQGHVDTTGSCRSVKDLNGSWEFVFEHKMEKGFVTVPKGSITVNGVSLTVVDSKDDGFSVHVIPYTFQHTNFKDLKIGSEVNLEFDILGKYIAKLSRL